MELAFEDQGLANHQIDRHDYGMHNVKIQDMNQCTVRGMNQVLDQGTFRGMIQSLFEFASGLLELLSDWPLSIYLLYFPY